MWDIYEKRSLQKDLKHIPQEVLIRYEAWKRIVELEGPSGLRLIKGFRDESLKGEWAGFRSSRLNLQWRVIYKVEKEVLEIYVIEITPHKY
jgi:addiction module RelE/StbE family toxin